MPKRYDSDDDPDYARSSGEREISLGTGTILGIFLALALVCSLFFGLGYSMGRKSTPALPPAAPDAVTTPSPIPPTDDAKPSPGTAFTRPAKTSPPGVQVVQPMDGAASSPEPTPETPPSKSLRATQTLAPTSTAPAPQGQLFVQVAAVSRREDADLLLTAMKRRGYTGILRQQPQDKLLHVQVGPFATKKDAEAMRQRLITDGYTPIIK